ncbi:YciI family protein [Actinophytocola gossypii]|uniref:Transcription initiation protein n=1 Tax=Actinophytocola gossypii TaxID=2812003 RepID=A0ABT2J6D9_9PSEU|nr:YciI family protein [Actinophytocola gossypii]MCT2582834.1 transcription initiation protein [Actinophytocola gossypii]
MRFMLMLCGDETAEASAEVMTGCAEWQREMRGRGVLLDALGLHPPASAGTVRVRAGEVLLTDGPFAETKEQMGGVTLIDCADRDEALRIAASHPWAEFGTIEVRQLYG